MRMNGAIGGGGDQKGRGGGGRGPPPPGRDLGGAVMHRVRCLVRGGLLAVALAIGMAASAHADIILSLNGVTFSDGGTASGEFGLNVYGYTTSPISITTTGPTFPSSVTYTSGGA